jgi:hypothetical protein
LNVRGFWFYGQDIVKTTIGILLLSIATLCAAQRVEPAGKAKAELPAAVSAAVQDHGLRVVDKDGAALVSVWLAKSVKTTKKEVEGANYPQLDLSSFIGVITLESDGKDLRGQSIAKGTYSLRYALLPSDGNHMGVAPNRDFLLLLPLSSDSDPATTYTEKQLFRASSKVAGTAHPTVLSLVADEGKPGTVSTSAEGFVVLHFSLSTSDGELPIAMIVKGVAQQ